MQDKVEILKSSATELLKLMGVNANVEVSFDESNSIFNVNLTSEDSTGLLIGKKGETLASIESILGFIFKSKVGEWFRIAVNIGDYKEKEQEYLKGLARSAANRVVESGKAENIYNLKGWQRRVVHMYLAEEFPQVVSESEGEGDERCLVIKPKNS